MKVFLMILFILQVIVVIYKFIYCILSIQKEWAEDFTAYCLFTIIFNIINAIAFIMAFNMIN